MPGSMLALAGGAPVEVLPSVPVYVGTTIDTQAVAAVLAPLAPSTPAVQAAIAALAQTTPGSIEALNAVDALGSAMALAMGSGDFVVPVLTVSQLTQAINLLDSLAESVRAAGVNTGGIEALRAGLASQAAAVGIIP